MDHSNGSFPNRVVSNGAPVLGDGDTNGSLRRKGSFSFLRRSKSRERSASASGTPARKLSKKNSMKRREREIQQEPIPPAPPRVPLVARPPDLPTFGGEDNRPDTAAIMSNRADGTYQRRLAQKASHEVVGSDTYRGMPIPPVPPIPPIPGETTPIYGRTPRPDQWAHVESMANRGRYSYASSAVSTINSPRKVRRRKEPTPYNILVLGARGSGKTSFLDFLRTSLTVPVSKQRQTLNGDDFDIPSIRSAFPNFVSQYVETEVDREKIGVTLWDSPGLELSMVDLQLKEITNFIESKFENTYSEESKVARTPGFKDTHIHCTFLVLDPSRLDANMTAQTKASQINGVKAQANSFVKSHPKPPPGGLDESLDLNVIRTLKGKTTVVPVIAKADSITTGHMMHLKRAVWQSLKVNKLETLEALVAEDDVDDASVTSKADSGELLVNERDEDRLTPHDSHRRKVSETDKFSITSHLESSSDSSSEFSPSRFNLAKPEKVKVAPNPAHSSPAPQVRAPSPPPVGSPPLPLSIISPDPYETGAVGRHFPWGFADSLNAEHCDFVKLKNQVFKEWRNDLREASREVWYEGWRTSRLNKKARRQGTISLGVTEGKSPIWGGD